MCLRQVPQRKNQTGYFDLDTSLVGCKGLPWASGRRYAFSRLGLSLLQFQGLIMDEVGLVLPVEVRPSHS